jgi:hypothetical protein
MAHLYGSMWTSCDKLRGSMDPTCVCGRGRGCQHIGGTRWRPPKLPSRGDPGLSPLPSKRRNWKLVRGVPTDQALPQLRIHRQDEAVVSLIQAVGPPALELEIEFVQLG